MQSSIRKFTVSVHKRKHLMFRLAEASDFDEVLKLRSGVHDGREHDYLPVEYHQWLQMDNSAVMLALDSEKPIGLVACFIVDHGKTVFYRGARVLPERRGRGVLREVMQALGDYLHRGNFPDLFRERLVAHRGHVIRSKNPDNPWRRIAEYDALYFDVEEKTARARMGKPALENRLKIESSTIENFSNVILSRPSTRKLFANNLLVVDRCPFEVLRSNIDFILKKHDLKLFVEKCSEPRSCSHGVLVQKAKAVEWLATVYSDDPVLFESHVLHHFKHACEVIPGKFTFGSFQVKSETPYARRVLTDVLNLKEVYPFNDEPLRVYERYYMPH